MLAGEQTSRTYTCAEQVRILLHEMREGVQAFDAIIVITREAIQVTLARKCPPAEMQATLQAAGGYTQLHSRAVGWRP